MEDCERYFTDSENKKSSDEILKISDTRNVERAKRQRSVDGVVLGVYDA